ncbi:MAG: hypothetical protein FWE08_07375 [Oscillospiraceae bacterium]|nr:hypothetical protein [Oscillospiraceae bacterium]
MTLQKKKQLTNFIIFLSPILLIGIIFFWLAVSNHAGYIERALSRNLSPDETRVTATEFSDGSISVGVTFTAASVSISEFGAYVVDIVAWLQEVAQGRGIELYGLHVFLQDNQERIILAWSNSPALFRNRETGIFTAFLSDYSESGFSEVIPATEIQGIIDSLLAQE